VGNRAAGAIQRQADFVDAEIAGQVLQHRPALAMPARRRVVDLGAGKRARDDEFALGRGIAIGKIVQVPLERDGGGLHLARRQAGGQPFARVGVDLQRQVAVDGGHGAADHGAAHVGAPRRRLAFALPLALQPQVDVVVGQVQLGDVHVPVLGVRPLDAGIQRQVAHRQRGLFEHARQGRGQLLGLCADRHVRGARTARQRHVFKLDEIAGQALNARLDVAGLHGGAFRPRRPARAAHRSVRGQLRELAAFQLQPGARADAAGRLGKFEPRCPGQRFRIVHLGIELPAPVAGIRRVHREQGAVEFPAQFEVARQRIAGRGPEDEAMRQAAVARQEVHPGKRQFGRLAPFVLPADCGAADPQLPLRGQPAQGGMVQVRPMAVGIQVDVLAGHPQMVGGIAPQRDLGPFDLQPHQRGRQGQDAAPAQHRGDGRQGQHGVHLVVVDLDGRKIEPGIQALPVRVDGADGDPGAQRPAGVGLDLGTPLVYPGKHPITHAQHPGGRDAVNSQSRPEQATEGFSCHRATPGRTAPLGGGGPGSRARRRGLF
jgi:hypothetical protein